METNTFFLLTALTVDSHVIIKNNKKIIIKNIIFALFLLQIIQFEEIRKKLLIYNYIWIITYIIYIGYIVSIIMILV